MTTKLNSLLMTAALTLSAAAAYAQNQVVANIPFSFRTAAGVQPAGQYAVSHEGEATKLRNLDSGKASLAGIGVPEDNDRSKHAVAAATLASQVARIRGVVRQCLTQQLYALCHSLDAHDLSRPDTLHQRSFADD